MTRRLVAISTLVVALFATIVTTATADIDVTAQPDGHPFHRLSGAGHLASRNEEWGERHQQRRRRKREPPVWTSHRPLPPTSRH